MVDQATLQADYIKRTDELAYLEELRQARIERYKNLSTGRRVNDVQDNPVDYYRAQVLVDRVADLAGQRGTIELDQSRIQVGDVGLSTIEDLSAQLSAIAYQARVTEYADQRADLARQFNEIRDQIDNVIRDSVFNGERPLENLDATTLGIGDATTDYNNFVTALDVRAALNSVDNAVSRVRSRQADYGSDLAALNVQENYNANLSNTIQAGADKLVNADLNEEAVQAVAIQVREDLTFQGQRILAQGDSLLLGLFK